VRSSARYGFALTAIQTVRWARSCRPLHTAEPHLDPLVNADATEVERARNPKVKWVRDDSGTRVSVKINGEEFGPVAGKGKQLVKIARGRFAGVSARVVALTDAGRLTVRVITPDGRPGGQVGGRGRFCASQLMASPRWTSSRNGAARRRS
jgi:hypothetical protein